MGLYDDYRAKLCSAEEAVRLVKSGDWVDYGSNNGFPQTLDAALAARRELAPSLPVLPAAGMVSVMRTETLCFSIGLLLFMRFGFGNGRGIGLLRRGLGLLHRVFRRFGNRAARGTRRPAGALFRLFDLRFDRFGPLRFRMIRFDVFCGTSALFRLRRGFLQHLDQFRLFILAIGRDTVLLCKIVQLGDRLCFQFGLNHKIPP